MLEEYYTLRIIANAGIGTSNIDGNTRLCTATAKQALCETFGTDGQRADDHGSGDQQCRRPPQDSSVR